MSTLEFNFDGLIGPTHNYAGLSFGNVASSAHRNQPSHPRAAALQGLKKMRTLAGLGVGQAILPPLRRPRFEALRAWGVVGQTPAELIESAWRISPLLVATCYSSASMWTANAATVSPSADCADRRLHLTPANLSSTLHRSLEGPSTTRMLRSIFADERSFCVHDPLPLSAALADEGAANHTRLSGDLDRRGFEVFVYGTDPMDPRSGKPQKYPARQTRLASESIARSHGLDPDSVFFWQQNPRAIDAGVFHNDVISVGNRNVLLTHELAFENQKSVLEGLSRRFESRFGHPLIVVEFSEAELPLADAVRSYLFNSQLVTRPDGGMTLICPIECDEIESVKRCTERMLEESNPIDDVKFLNLRQSMNNGGGPACLRLRAVLDKVQQTQIHSGVIFNDRLAQQLEDWVNQHYRETLAPGDLRDPHLIGEVTVAIEALAAIVGLPVEVLLDS